ncbi:toxin-antitoxin system YwqK family antitoxin [Formosa sp. 3Alg 14/1]|uniref:toxin-antitoxin system YwqK family antitoxin n=1 Tax=Formosa sp. 3Alg 14/1 TaxID=3382190 RepID=UPI0039BE9007
MKTYYFIAVFSLFFFIGCNTKTANKKEISTDASLDINSIEVLKSDLVLNQVEGRWYYKDKPYFGYSVAYHSNDTLAEKIGFVNGKREGIARRWSDKGILRVELYYKHNRLDGVYKTWWDNSVLSSQTYYENGVKQGSEKEWYPTGQLAKHRQLVNGKENGLQKAWLKNGTLYVNYEAKNGRIFGMKRANSCYKLENEVIKKDKKL